MATGDVKNNLRKLLTEVKKVRYPQYIDSDESGDELDIRALANGQPQAFLPILHFVFLDYSYLLAQYLAERDYELYAKTDLRFVEVVYKILRNEFGFKPQLTKEQFLTLGFAEQKIILLCTVLKLCQDKHKQLECERVRAGKTKSKSTPDVCRSGKKNTSTLHRSLNQTRIEQKKSNSISQTATRAAQNRTKKLLVSNKHPRSGMADGSVGTSKKNVCSASLYPLVRKEVHNNYVFQVENKENRPKNIINNHGTELHSQKYLPFSNAAQSNIIPSECAQEVQNTRDISNRRSDNSVNSTWLSLQKKCVTWEDEVHNGHQSMATSDSSTSRDRFMPASDFVPANRMSQEAVPVPVTMTAAPQPSPELLLTPINKSKHQPIPLSGARGVIGENSGSNVSLIDVTGSDNINEDHFQIIRHPASPKLMMNKGIRNAVVESGKFDGNVNVRNEKSDDDSLKYQLSEMKEKLDHLLSLNDHLSSRIILLETRVKFLEEGQSNFIGLNAKSHNHQSKQNIATREGDKVNSEITNEVGAKIPQTDLESARVIISSDESDRSFSGSDDENDDVDLALKDPVETNSFVHSPKVAFVDPSTKATVLNVHKRLRETREMLTNTNKTFAARFNHATLSESV